MGSLRNNRDFVFFSRGVDSLIFRPAVDGGNGWQWEGGSGGIRGSLAVGVRFDGESALSCQIF